MAYRAHGAIFLLGLQQMLDEPLRGIQLSPPDEYSPHWPVEFSPV
jgi:hypothetical protein